MLRSMVLKTNKGYFRGSNLGYRFSYKRAQLWHGHFKKKSPAAAGVNIVASLRRRTNFKRRRGTKTLYCTLLIFNHTMASIKQNGDEQFHRDYIFLQVKKNVRKVHAQVLGRSLSRCRYRAHSISPTYTSRVAKSGFSHYIIIIFRRWRIFNEIGFAIFFIIDEEDHQKSFQKKGTSFVYHLLFWLIGVTAISCARDLVALGISSEYSEYSRHRWLKI